MSSLLQLYGEFDFGQNCSAQFPSAICCVTPLKLPIQVEDTSWRSVPRSRQTYFRRSSLISFVQRLAKRLDGDSQVELNVTELNGFPKLFLNI